MGANRQANGGESDPDEECVRADWKPFQDKLKAEDGGDA